MINWKSGYRHYNHLMDISFWFLLIAYTRGLLSLVGVPEEFLLNQWQPLNMVLGVIFLFIHFVLIVLIMARSLRDEYAEKLWQKSAASFVSLLPIFPFLWIAGIFVLGDQYAWLDALRANPEISILPDHAVLPNPTKSVGIHQFEGLNFVVLKLTQYFPLLFAALYKWHRWQDER